MPGSRDHRENPQRRLTCTACGDLLQHHYDDGCARCPCRVPEPEAEYRNVLWDEIMTREEFESYWAGNSGISVEKMHQMGLRAEECECSNELCLGWAVDWDHRKGEVSRG